MCRSIVPKCRRLFSEGRIVNTSVERAESAVVPLADMTSRQLIRRAKIIEEVIELIGDVGADAVQMRDVAQRSGVALATVYRYFSSKEHLLAAALEDWQKRLTRRITTAARTPDQDPTTGILDYLRRAQRAFHRNPEMTALMVQMMTSADPLVRGTFDEMNRTNAEMFNRLLGSVAPEDIPNVSFGINAALASAVTGLLTDRLTLDESLSQVEWVARVLLGGKARTTPST